MIFEDACQVLQNAEKKTDFETGFFEPRAAPQVKTGFKPACVEIVVPQVTLLDNFQKIKSNKTIYIFNIIKLRRRVFYI